MTRGGRTWVAGSSTTAGVTSNFAAGSIPLVILGLVTFWLPLRENALLTLVVACALLILLVPALMSYL